MGEAPPTRRRRVWPWFILGMFVGVVLLLLSLSYLLVNAMGSIGPEGGGRALLEDEEDEQGVFVVVPVEGVIMDADAGDGNPVAWVRSCLKAAAEEENLKGILLRVNSPGGGIRASDEILRLLREFKAEHKVPVVAWMKDVAASGGYYVCMCADWIVAHESTVTASIGVIWSTMNWEGLTKEKLGLRLGNLKSAPMKDIGSPNRDMTEPERALIQDFVDESFGAFVSLVVKGREGKRGGVVTEASVRGLESTILSGRRAFAEGLVDELGSYDTVLAKLRELSGVDRADLVAYTRPRGWMDLLLGSAEPEPLAGTLSRLSFLYSEGPALLALWER